MQTTTNYILNEDRVAEAAYIEELRALLDQARSYLKTASASGSHAYLGAGELLDLINETLDTN